MTETTDFYLGVMRAYAKRNKNYVDALMRDCVFANKMFYAAPVGSNEEHLWYWYRDQIEIELEYLMDDFFSVSRVSIYLNKIGEEDEYSPFS